MAESLGLLLAVLGVGLGSVGFALRAVWRPPAGGWGARLLAARDGALAERKEAALVALRELDHDHRVGSLEAADYRRLRAELAADAVHALKAEDEQAVALDAAGELRVEAWFQKPLSPRVLLAEVEHLVAGAHPRETGAVHDAAARADG